MDSAEVGSEWRRSKVSDGGRLFPSWLSLSLLFDAPALVVRLSYRQMPRWREAIHFAIFLHIAPLVPWAQSEYVPAGGREKADISAQSWTDLRGF